MKGNLTVIRAPVQARHARGRSSLSNKVDALLKNVDGRNVLAKLYRDICGDIASDLGGAEGLSAVQHGLIRRYAGLAVLAEQYESRLLQGKDVNLQDMAQIASVMSRLAARIGVKRHSPAVPDIRDYINGKARDITPKRARITDDDDDE
jgi:hypothetical protein